jgi:tRNA modification GTPase
MERQRPTATTDIDTVVAIATPLGAGGLGVVRLSGPRALSIVQSLFRSSQGRSGPALEAMISHTLHHGFLHDGRGILDEVVVGIFRAPRSYTGEDVVEISCHGGPVILKAALEACRIAGAALAGPGEFTKRAYLNGKMDLSQAEAVADLISSRSEAARRIALEQLNGGFSRTLKPLKEALTELLAGLEANLDFVEEDIPPVPRAELLEKLSALMESFDGFIMQVRSGRLLRDGARLVIVGKPNAGKSSLFNRLVNFERSIVTSVPGTTRDTLEETIEINGFGLVLIDTAGWREASDPVEGLGVSRTEAALAAADGVLFVADSSRGLEEEDRRLARRIGNSPTVAVLNKSDLPRRLEHGEVVSLLRGEARRGSVPSVATSSATGEGLSELKALLPRVFFGEGRPGALETPALANARHMELLAGAREALESARLAASGGLSEECVSLELKRSFTALAGITGENVQEEILDVIFSKFCIGK